MKVRVMQSFNLWINDESYFRGQVINVKSSKLGSYYVRHMTRSFDFIPKEYVEVVRRI